ncbi:hypothetical protein GCM10022268_32400 [Sphingomonas cynarae]|uniref:MBL fold metallo-hydrolase n=1 Tax=Sphingomonas cynarae TaxID=930197 RepID=A0ABP7ENU5_9SPHN
MTQTELPPGNPGRFSALDFDPMGDMLYPLLESDRMVIIDIGSAPDTAVLVQGPHQDDWLKRDWDVKQPA